MTAKPTTGLGALLGVVAFPHVLSFARAVGALWNARPPGVDEIVFLDYEVLDVFRWAFIALHAWLVYAIMSWPRHSTSRARLALVLLGGAEIGFVYSVWAYLRTRGFPLSPF